MECVVRNTTRDAVLAERVRVAASPLARLRGLLGTSALAPGHGLLLRPCRQVHSFFMRYALDLVFVDADDRVVETVAAFPTNRISPLVSSAAAVLELPAGALAAAPARPGDRLSIAPRTDAAER
jgi:uncharacterized membrane protein (UPF0127 family)